MNAKQRIVFAVLTRMRDEAWPIYASCLRFYGFSAKLGQPVPDIDSNRAVGAIAGALKGYTRRMPRKRELEQAVIVVLPLLWKAASDEIKTRAMTEPAERIDDDSK